MQDEWKDKFQKQLNEELDLENITPENSLIQKTLLRIYTTQPESDSSQKEKKKKFYLPRWLSLLAAAIIVICLLIPIMIPKSFKNDSDFDMNNMALPTQSNSSGNEDKKEFQINSSLKDTADLPESEEIQEAADETGSGLNILDGVSNSIQDDTKQFITITFSDGKVIEVSSKEKKGEIILSILEDAQETKEVFKEEIETPLYTISIITKEGEENFLFYESGWIVQKDENIKEDIFYQTEKLEELKKVLEEN